MQTASYTPSAGANAVIRARDWMDDRGRPAWLVAMVLGFIAFWPVGLAILFYLIWSKRMAGFCSHRGYRSGHHGHGSRSTGNTAFDAYRDETLRRLEDEHRAFLEFLEKLREAKDKSEFDQFMAQRQQP